MEQMDTTKKDRLRRKRNLTFGLLLLFAGLVSAAYFITLEETTVIGNVVGRDETPLVWENTFPPMELNTENTNATATINATFTNEAGNISGLFVNITENRTDVADECLDFENDCVAEFFLNSELVQNGDTVTALDGVNLVEYRLHCRRFSCPQTWNSSIGLSE